MLRIFSSKLCPSARVKYVTAKGLSNITPGAISAGSPAPDSCCSKRQKDNVQCRPVCSDIPLRRTAVSVLCRPATAVIGKQFAINKTKLINRKRKFNFTRGCYPLKNFIIIGIKLPGVWHISSFRPRRWQTLADKKPHAPALRMVSSHGDAVSKDMSCNKAPIIFLSQIRHSLFFQLQRQIFVAGFDNMPVRKKRVQNQAQYNSAGVDSG